jgi:HEPN domain-containing protein
MTASARDWLTFARDDLAAANQLAGRKGVPHASAYSAQQCAEKALKAALIAAGVLSAGQDPPRIHDLDRLRNMLPVGWDVKRRHRNLGRLTLHGVQSRYPDDSLPAVTGREAAGARRTATSIYSSIKVDLATRGVNVQGL